MNWEECEKILINLAKRAGSVYNNEWYGESWDGLLVENGKSRYTCFICNKEFVSYPIAIIAFSKEASKKAAKEHGIQHLKEKNLTAFL